MKDCAAQTRLIMIGRGSAYLPKLRHPSYGVCPESQTLNARPALPKIIRCENPPVEAQLLSEISKRSTVPIQPKLEPYKTSVYMRTPNCPFDAALLSKRCVDIDIGIAAAVANSNKLDQSTAPRHNNHA